MEGQENMQKVPGRSSNNATNAKEEDAPGNQYVIEIDYDTCQ